MFAVRKIKRRKVMKKVLFLFVVSVLLTSCADQQQWHLVWEENFDGKELDASVWSRIPRAEYDWQDTMSNDERCYEMRDGKLILRGIINEDLQKDSSPYLTGGIWTKGKRSFERGRIEIRARLQAAQGAWPAIWILPDNSVFSKGGEVEIMERLNHDTFVYQTVCACYPEASGEEKLLSQGVTVPVRMNDFNVFGVDFWPDSLVFHVNGVRTFAYEREFSSKKEVFPFDVPNYLLIDMQLGGTWVGEVDPSGLPVEMAIDWVRHYQWK